MSPRPYAPRYRPRPANPAPLIVGGLLCALLMAGFYWLAVLRPAAEQAARGAAQLDLERATQRAIDARARALQTLERVRWQGAP